MQLSNKANTETVVTESGLGIESAIQSAVAEALSNPLPHSVFRLEIIFRESKAVRWVTATERSYLVENTSSN